MPDNLLIPSVDLRIGGLEEFNRRQKEKAATQHKRPKPRPCLTLSREFGCEGYPVAEQLLSVMQQRTGDQWVLIDRAIMDEVARRHNISEEILHHLGEKNRVLTEVLATFSPRWKSDHEHFQLLCRHVIALAEQGNVIIVGMGGAVITRHIEHSYHFRIYGSLPFKTASIATRLGISHEDAERMVEKKQRERDRFIRNFLGQDGHHPGLYDLLFNNDRNKPERIVRTIADYVLAA